MLSTKVEEDLRTAVLKSANAGRNTLSSLLNDKTIVKSPEDVDALITELCRMVALSLIELEPIEEDNSEKDLRITLTDLGKVYLKYASIV